MYIIPSHNNLNFDIVYYTPFKSFYSHITIQTFISLAYPNSYTVLFESLSLFKYNLGKDNSKTYCFYLKLFPLSHKY